MRDEPLYWQPLKSGRSKQEIKRSRFLGYAEAIHSEAEARRFMADVRAQERAARHICYAWRIRGEAGGAQEERFSDQGEPSGTAGLPILKQIRHSGLENVLVLVVRYFGGILLGTGGLSRAYAETAALALADAGRAAVQRLRGYRIQMAYADHRGIRARLEREGIELQEECFGALVTAEIWVPEGRSEPCLRAIQELSGGRASLDFLDVQDRVNVKLSGTGEAR